MSELSEEQRDLAAAAAACNPVDWQALFALQQRITAFGESAGLDGHDGLKHALELVDQVILEQAPDPVACLEEVGSLLQELPLATRDDEADQHTPEAASTADHATAVPEPTDNARLHEVGEALNDLATRIETCSPRDWQGLDHIKQDFATIAATFDGPKTAICEAGMALVDQIILDEVEDLDEAMLDLMDLIKQLDHHEVELDGPAPESGPQPPTAPKEEAVDEADLALADSRPLPEDAEPELVASLAQEAEDHLANIEGALLEADGGGELGDETINAMFRGFHTIKGLAGFCGLDRVQRLSHVTEEMLDRARDHHITLEEKRRSLIFQSVDALRHMISEAIEACQSGAPLQAMAQLPTLIANLRTATNQQIGELLLESHMISRADLDQALQAQQQSDEGKRLGEVLVEQGKVSDADLQLALKNQASQQKQPAAATKKAKNKPPQMLKVDAARIDSLCDLIGELNVAQGMLAGADPELRMGTNDIKALLGGLDRIVRTLQDMATNLRLVPVRPLFQRIARLVRDVAQKTGKPVRFVSEGDDVELDKNLVDQLSDPLVHMARNAVDHGIEADPADREAAGKPREGTIMMRAFHDGGYVHIELTDDGRGLDRQRIRAKAIEKNVIRAEQQLSDREIDELIFAPGFSTASEVSDLSGRGVGMDVVKQTIEDMRGQALIRSQPGEGSAFTLVLPLTTAIIDGMLVRLGGQTYIIPIVSIVSSLCIDRRQTAHVLDFGELLDFQGKQIPLVNGGAILDSAARPPASEDTKRKIVIVSNGVNEVAVEVDDIVGRQQVVIKALGSELPKLPAISGATITREGAVTLIIDVGGFVRKALAIRQQTTTGSAV